MTKSIVIAFLAALLMSGHAPAVEKKKRADTKQKAEVGASCKAPAVGACASCSITCPVGQTATCAGGQVAGNVCHVQPSCKCSR